MKEKFTPESLNTLCESVADRWINVSLIAPHRGEASFKLQMLRDLRNDVWNYIGAPDDSDYRVAPLSLSDEHLYKAVMQETINMVLSYCAYTFPPEPIIAAAIQRAVDSWRDRGRPQQTKEGT